MVGQLRGFEQEGTAAAHRVEQRRTGLPASEAQDAGGEVLLQRCFDGFLPQAALPQRRPGGIDIESVQSSAVRKAWTRTSGSRVSMLGRLSHS